MLVENLLAFGFLQHETRSNRVAEKLDVGDQFPSMTLQLVDGGEMNIPNDLQSDYTVVLFYRGDW